MTLFGSKSKKATIKIDPSQVQCHAGDIVTGNVYLDFHDERAEETSCKLVLKLVGYLNSVDAFAPSDFGSSGSSSRSAVTSRDKERIIYHSVELASFGDTTAGGQHTYPFSLVVPPLLLPAMATNNGANQFAIVYGFEAALVRPSDLKFNTRDKLKLTVYGKPDLIGDDGDEKGITVGPQEQTVGGLFRRRSTITHGLYVDNPSVRQEESIRVAVAARNDSSVKVVAMTVELKEIMTWEAQGQTDTSTTVVASLIVPGSELPGVQSTRGSGGRMTTDARTEVQEHLRASAASGALHQVVVPATCCGDVTSERVQVTHVVSAKLQLKGILSKSVEISTPLRVRHVARVTSVSPAEESTTKPISIPASAIKQEFLRSDLRGV